MKVVKGAIFCSGNLENTESLVFLVPGLNWKPEKDGYHVGVGRKEIRHGKVCGAVSWTPVIPGQGRRQLC